MAVLAFRLADHGDDDAAGVGGAAYVAHVDDAEREVLVDVVDQVVELLGGADAADAGPLRLGAPPVAPPADPALRRLLPDGSRGDAEVAAEFRRLTESDLRATKVTNLLGLRAALRGAHGRFVVPRAAAPGIAAALTDVRLVLAERLGVRTDADAAALEKALDAAVAAMEGGADDEERRDDDEPTVGAQALFLASVHQVLGLLQDSLVELMLDDLPDHDEPGEPPDGPEPAASSR